VRSEGPNRDQGARLAPQAASKAPRHARLGSNPIPLEGSTLVRASAIGPSPRVAGSPLHTRTQGRLRLCSLPVPRPNLLASLQRKRCESEATVGEATVGPAHVHGLTFLTSSQREGVIQASARTCAALWPLLQVLLLCPPYCLR